MSKAILYITASLDGFIADGEGGVDWLTGGQDTGYHEFMHRISTIIMGRTTYDQIKGFNVPWPYDGKKVVVVTHRDIEDPDEGVEAEEGDIGAIIALEKQMAETDVWILGGADIVNQCLDAGCLDVVDLFVQPVLLGEGIPLFKGSIAALNLMSAEKLDMGLVRLQYEVEK